MSDEAFTDMCNAFQRLIDAHCQSKSPFHNPVNADAMVALRTLRALRAQLAAAEARAERLSAAALDVIEFNRQHAHDQYGDADKCETWACVRTLRAALAEGEVG